MDMADMYYVATERAKSLIKNSNSILHIFQKLSGSSITVMWVTDWCWNAVKQRPLSMRENVHLWTVLNNYKKLK